MISASIVPGIASDGTRALVVVALLLSLFNVVLKPLLVLFTLPFILVTMGLGMLVINALLFLLAGRLVQGFHVAGFWSAFGGALVVGATNLIVNLFRGRPPLPPPPPPPPTPRSQGPTHRVPTDDVIDI
jgi:putative membrane protein